MFQFSSRTAALFYFFLAAPGKLHHRVAVDRVEQPPYQILHPARLTITAPGSRSPRHALFRRDGVARARQFLRGKTKLLLTQNPLTQTPLTQTLSAARIFALRDRGLLSISPSDAVTGFFVSNRKYLSFAPSRIASLTILSSSEWKLITTNLPPGFSTRGAAPSSAFRSSSSRFTNIRRA